MKTWVQNPIATLLLAGSLSCSAWLVNRQAGALPDPLHKFSTALLSTGRASGLGELLLVVRALQDMKVMDPDNESWDEATRELAKRESDAFHVVWVPGYRDCRGVYAGTWEGRRWGIWIESAAFRGLVTPEDAVLIRRAVLAWDRSLSTPRSATLSDRDAEALVLTGSVFIGSRVWTGYLHNGLALAALLLFLYSLAWIPRVPAWVAMTRAQRRLARGRCPHCNYSILGLPEPFCPECGKGWNITAEDDPPPAKAQQ